MPEYRYQIVVLRDYSLYSIEHWNYKNWNYDYNTLIFRISEIKNNFYKSLKLHDWSIEITRVPNLSKTKSMKKSIIPMYLYTRRSNP